MKWTRGHRSDQVEDRRNQRQGGLASGGGRPLSLGLPMMLFSKFGFPGLLVGAALLYFGGGLSGGDPSGGTSSYDDPSMQQGAGPQATGNAEEQPLVEFVSFVLDDVQATWGETLSGRYEPARMVLFRGQTPSACGMGQAAMGPFYCPGDHKVYIDLSFYQDLRRRFGAPGDFAQAYVIAHEIGHHVQNLLGDSGRVHRAPREQQEGAGGLSVRLELQADCYAGLWARSADSRDLLEMGDLEEALTAAAAIGDDTLQRQAGGRVAPESFTHGSSEQRARWFRRGYDSGALGACDTFSEPSL